MVKIKRKVQKNLPQLIEWIEKNGIRNHVFISDIDRNEVEINIHGCIFCKYITLKDTFTVEVEEEITEDTVMPKVLNVFKNTANRIRNDEKSYIRRNVSIKEIKESSKDYIENDRLYIMNDDLTMTLIWHDGKLVE